MDPKAPFSSDPSASLPERYQIQRKLGEGAYGMVFQALDQETSRMVAIKVLVQPEGTSRERFLREAQLASSVRHPNLYQIFDVAETPDELLYAVFEYVPGESLADALEFDGPLPHETIQAYVEGILDGIEALHGQGILHRDLKPDNILIDTQGRPRVVDFGLAFVDEDGRTRITETGVVLGTPSYMAPELFLGEPATPASDLYALGAITFEMLYQERFRPESTIPEFLRMSLLPPEEFLPRARLTKHPSWDPWLRRLLRKSPPGRPSSCQKARELLSRVPSQEGKIPGDSPTQTLEFSPPRLDPESRAGEGSRKGPPWVLSGLAVLLVGLGLASLGSLRTEPLGPQASSLPKPEVQAEAPEARQIAKLEYVVSKLPLPGRTPDFRPEAKSLRALTAANLPAKVRRYLEAVDQVRALSLLAPGSPLEGRLYRATTEFSAEFLSRLEHWVHDAERTPLLRARAPTRGVDAGRLVLTQFQRLQTEIRFFFLDQETELDAQSPWLDEAWILFTLPWARTARIPLPPGSFRSLEDHFRSRGFRRSSIQIFASSLVGLDKIGIPLGVARETLLGILEASASAPPEHFPRADRHAFLPGLWTLTMRSKFDSKKDVLLQETRTRTLDFFREFDPKDPGRLRIWNNIQKHLKPPSRFRANEFGKSALDAPLEAVRRELHDASPALGTNSLDPTP